MQVANLQIAIEQAEGITTRVFASIDGAPLAELKIAAKDAQQGVCRFAAAVGSKVAGEIRRSNVLGHSVSTPFQFVVAPPATAHAQPQVSVETYADQKS
ncbi:MAG: hypothetical protein ACLQLG_18670 [Thermoguttaceae bacterium]